MTVNEFVDKAKKHLEIDIACYPDEGQISQDLLETAISIIERQREALGKIYSSPVPITGGYTEKLIAIASTALSSEV